MFQVGVVCDIFVIEKTKANFQLSSSTPHNSHLKTESSFLKSFVLAVVVSILFFFGSSVWILFLVRNRISSFFFYLLKMMKRKR